MAPTKVTKPPKAIEKPAPVRPITKSKKKKKNYVSFSIYIYKVLRTVAADGLGISRHSMLIMDNFVADTLERLASEAGRLASRSRRTTLGAREIASALKLIVPGELAAHAHMEATKALAMYHRSRQADAKRD